MKKQYLLPFSILSLLTISPVAVAATITQNSDVNTLISTLLGNNSGITVVGTPTISGNFAQFGTFSQGNVGAGLGIDSGIVLSTGIATDSIGSYDLNDSGTDLNGAGSSKISAMVNNPATGDAATIKFSFTSSTDSLYFLNYVFASQEYPEFVRSPFNDGFGYFVDGVNIAKVPGTNLNVSVNTINNGNNDSGVLARNPQYYIPNRNNNRTLQFGGLTVPLSASANGLGSGVHTLEIVIADVNDGNLDSAVFLSANSLSSSPIYGSVTQTVPEPFGIFGTLVGTSAALYLRKKMRSKKSGEC